MIEAMAVMLPLPLAGEGRGGGAPRDVRAWGPPTLTLPRKCGRGDTAVGVWSFPCA